MDKQAVLITGSSSGIGYITANTLAKEGFKVFAGVRNQEDFEKLSCIGENVFPVMIDITDKNSIDKAYSYVKENLNGEKLTLVNNAGVAISCPIEFIDIENIKKQFDVNVIGQIRMIQAFLPILRESKGKIINISSILGSLPLPYTAPYCASKSALEVLTDGLRVELIKWGINVILIKPGIVKTSIWQKSSDAAKNDFKILGDEAACLYGEEFNILTTISSKLGHYGCEPKDAANLIFKIIKSKKPKSTYLLGYDSVLISFIIKLPQKIVEKIVIGSIKYGKSWVRKKRRKTD